MSGRVTPPKDPDDDVPSLRDRSPLMWWVAVIAIVALILGSTGGVLLMTIF
jgi:hypothetical protein